MTRKPALGRGLDALIPSGEAAEGGGIVRIPIDEVRRSPRQPRAGFDAQSLQELSQSIREHGVLQPLLVTRDSDGQGFTLIAGERRLIAARLAGLSTVPAIVRPVQEQQRLEITLIENLQRADLNPLEAAEGYRQLAEEFGLAHDEIAQKVGKSRVAISNTLRLLKLPPSARDALASGAISEGHARALLSLATPQAQAAALKAIVERNLNVRQAEELVRRLGGQRRTAPRRKSRQPEEAALEESLRQWLGTRVTLRRGRRGGSLRIYFYSDEELNAIVDRLLRST